MEPSGQEIWFIGCFKGLKKAVWMRNKHCTFLFITKKNTGKLFSRTFTVASLPNHKYRLLLMVTIAEFEII